MIFAADRQKDTKYSSIIADLELRFGLGCDDANSPLSSSQTVRTPIQMMGGLVSPHLLEAQVGTRSLYYLDVVSLVRTASRYLSKHFLAGKFL